MVTAGAAAGARGAPGAARMKFRGAEARVPPLGTRPTTAPASIREVFTVMLLHVCKKSIFFDTNIKVGLYLAVIFLVSLLADVSTFPKSYFSRSDNFFNVFFVKIGWFWTLLLTGPFALMTSYTHCCGRRDRIVKGHLTRLAIATLAWYVWTSLFNYVERTYGRCIPNKAFDSKQACLKNSQFWSGFDISGHCFILIYSSLVLVEEARAIVGWEGIGDLVRDEDYARSVEDKTVRSNPLRNLTRTELSSLRRSHERFTPYVRAAFVAMTALQLLWDVMLFCTLIYYHIMVEKFISGTIAVLTWYVTYRGWYTLPKYFPNLPGEGIFKYGKGKGPPSVAPVSSKKRASLVGEGKRFMGMPLYGPRQQDSAEPPSDDRASQPPPSPR